MAFIIVMTGINEGDYHELRREVNIVGRSSTLPIHINDITISREHMKICFNEDKQGYFVENFKSRNGVFVNGRKIIGTKKLSEGDCITIGQTNLLFTLGSIVDHESAIARFKISQLDFPTMNISLDSLSNFKSTLMNENDTNNRNLIDWAGSKNITLAIVFTDIIDSTSLTHMLGNECMNQIRRNHFARTRSLIEQYNGFEIKTNGDEFLVVFHTALDSLDFTINLQADTGDKRIRIRAGIHLGPVIVEEDDVQGMAVSYTARIIGMAAYGGIWLSNEVKNHIEQDKAQRHKDISWEPHPDCVLKGFPGKYFLWSVNSKDSSVE